MNAAVLNPSSFILRPQQRGVTNNDHFTRYLHQSKLASMAHLFVLDLVRTAGLELTEQHLNAHRDYLAQHYATGVFLASGRKESRTGGIILAQGNRDEIEKIIASGPLRVNAAVEYRITEFIPTMTAPALAEFQESLS